MQTEHKQLHAEELYILQLSDLIVCLGASKNDVIITFKIYSMGTSEIDCVGTSEIAECMAPGKQKGLPKQRYWLKKNHENVHKTKDIFNMDILTGCKA